MLGGLLLLCYPLTPPKKTILTIDFPIIKSSKTENSIHRLSWFIAQPFARMLLFFSNYNFFFVRRFHLLLWLYFHHSALLNPLDECQFAKSPNFYSHLAVIFSYFWTITHKSYYFKLTTELQTLPSLLCLTRPLLCINAQVQRSMHSLVTAFSCRLSLLLFRLFFPFLF